MDSMHNQSELKRKSYRWGSAVCFREGRTSVPGAQLSNKAFGGPRDPFRPADGTTGQQHTAEATEEQGPFDVAEEWQKTKDKFAFSSVVLRMRRRFRVVVEGLVCRICLVWVSDAWPSTCVYASP